MDLPSNTNLHSACRRSKALPYPEVKTHIVMENGDDDQTGRPTLPEAGTNPQKAQL